MKTLFSITLLAASMSTLAVAQKLEVNLEPIAAKASDKTELVLDGMMLQMLKGAMAKKAGADQSPLANVDSVSLHNFEFSEAGKYSDKDLEGLRKQLTSSAGWSRVLKTKDAQDDTEIYLRNSGGQVNEFVLIAAEPKELTVVQVSGSVQLAQLEELVKSTVQYTAQ